MSLFKRFPRRRLITGTRLVPAGIGGIYDTAATDILLPQNLITVPGVQYEDFESAAEWVVVDGAAANNAVNFITGTQSITLTSNAGATPTMTKTVNWNLSGNWHSAGFWYYVHNPDHTDYGNDMRLWLSNDAVFNNYMRCSKSISTIRAETDGWNYCIFPKGSFTATGAGTWANPITRVRLSFSAAAGDIAALSFDDLQFGAQRVPAIIMCFDDGYVSQYTAFLYAKQFKIRGSIADRTDISLITVAQYQQMNAAGWAVCNHTNNVTDLSTLPLVQQEAQINGGITDLTARGMPGSAHYLILPSGGFNADTRTACTNLGITLARRAGAASYAEGMVLPHIDLLNTISAGFSVTPVADAITMVNTAIAREVPVGIYWHEFGAAGQWTLANYYTFVDFIRGETLAGRIYPITLDDYYRLTLGPITIPRVI